MQSNRRFQSSVDHSKIRGISRYIFKMNIYAVWFINCQRIILFQVGNQTASMKLTFLMVYILTKIK